MKLKPVLRHTAVLATLLWAGVANAALYNFDISGDYSAHWQLDSSVVPDSPVDGVLFNVFDAPGLYAGATTKLADLTFYNSAIGGGLTIYDYYGGNVLLIADSPQLYSGTESAPTFHVGTYALTQYYGSGNYTLTVTSAVPEPATYGMLVAGLGLMGAALRRRPS